MKKSRRVELSIIILTYNNEKDLPRCLAAVYRHDGAKFARGEWQLTVVDNASQDGTIPGLRLEQRKYPGLSIIENKENLGFAKANNLAVAKTTGRFVLFLNPDTVVEKGAISIPLSYLKAHHNVGIVTAKLVLGNGQIDMTCHRGFPTPWNSFCYFSGLARLFPRSRLFSGYTLGYLDTGRMAEIDAVTGAYLLMPKDLGESLGWFDVDFFWKGEDLDLCYRVKQAGLRIVYLPEAVVHHYKGSSRGHVRGSRTLAARFEVMRLFYEKHYRGRYPAWVRWLVMAGVNIRQWLSYLGV
jgi:GT2 family glycosyltransferase